MCGWSDWPLPLCVAWRYRMRQQPLAIAGNSSSATPAIAMVLYQRIKDSRCKRFPWFVGVQLQRKRDRDAECRWMSENEDFLVLSKSDFRTRHSRDERMAVAVRLLFQPLAFAWPERIPHAVDTPLFRQFHHGSEYHRLLQTVGTILQP